MTGPPTGRAEQCRRGGWRRSRFALLALSLVAVTGGCGYMVGGAYSPEVRTVAVPVFESNDYRRGLELQLTEAVQRQIKDRSPFRLAKEPYADTVLRGKVVLIRKGVLGIDGRVDQGRKLELEMAVKVVWEDVATGRVLAERNIPLPPEARHLVQQSQFAPEVGQSFATGSQEVVDRLARSIVDMMEAPW